MVNPLKVPHSRGPKTVKIDPGHILDAAQRVFAREGIRGASIRAISREANCDPALIYYHFANKEAVFSSLLDRKFPALAQAITQIADAADDRHTAERLWDVLLVYRRLLLDDAGFRALIRGEIVIGTEGIKDAIAQRIHPVLHALSALFEQGIQRGHLRADLVPPLCSFFLVRPYVELLDMIPLMAQRIVGIPPGLILPLAECFWFELYWRGIAARPDEPLPFLQALKESHP